MHAFIETCRAASWWGKDGSDDDSASKLPVRARADVSKRVVCRFLQRTSQLINLRILYVGGHVSTSRDRLVSRSSRGCVVFACDMAAGGVATSGYRISSQREYEWNQCLRLDRRHDGRTKKDNRCVKKD